jgi:cbb3-type cytochrome oxidase subunit 3
MPSDFPWSIVLILGPAILLLVIIWAYMRNRAAGRGNVERAEDGAVRLREEIERDSDPR